MSREIEVSSAPSPRRKRNNVRRSDSLATSPDDAHANLTVRTASNAVVNAGGALWGGVLALISTAILIPALGAELYGVYVLLAAALGYVSLVELNLSSALVKYVAEYAARSETKEIEQVIGTTISLYLALSLGATCLFLVGGRVLLPFLHIPDQYLPMAWRALVISALALPLTLLSSTLATIPGTVGRFDLAVLATSAVATTSTAATIVIALLGGTLVAFAIANAVTAAAATLLYVAIGSRLFPGVSFRPRWSGVRASVLLRFSVFSFLSKLSGTLLATVDRLAIGFVLGPAAVAYYAAPAGLMRRASSVTHGLAYVVLPVASALAGRLDHARLQRGYIRSARITWCIALVLSIVLFVGARPLLTLWIGADFSARGAWVLRVLAVAFLFETASNVPALVTEGMGFPKVTGAFAVASAIVNLALIVPSLRYMGINGAAVTWVVACALTVPFFVHHVQKTMVTLTWRQTIHAIYWPRLAVLRNDALEVWRALSFRLRPAPRDHAE